MLLNNQCKSLWLMQVYTWLLVFNFRPTLSSFGIYFLYKASVFVLLHFNFIKKMDGWNLLVVLLLLDGDVVAATVSTLYIDTNFYKHMFCTAGFLWTNCKASFFFLLWICFKEQSLFYFHSWQNSSPQMKKLCMQDCTGIWTWSCMYESPNVSHRVSMS